MIITYNDFLIYSTAIILTVFLLGLIIGYHQGYIAGINR
jgi:predicted transporter